MSFKEHWLSIPVAERDVVARQAMTTKGTLHQVAYTDKRIELGLADCLVALFPGLTLEDLPLTERARQQAVVRSFVPLNGGPSVEEASHG